MDWSGNQSWNKVQLVIWLCPGISTSHCTESNYHLYHLAFPASPSRLTQFTTQLVRNLGPEVCLNLKCVLYVQGILSLSREEKSPSTSYKLGSIHTTTFKRWINISQSLLRCALGCNGPSPNNRILTCIIHPSLIHSSLTQTHRGIQLSQTKLQIRKPFKTSAPPSSNLRGTLSRLAPPLIMLTLLNNASLTRISQSGRATNPSARPNANE